MYMAEKAFSDLKKIKFLTKGRCRRIMIFDFYYSKLRLNYLNNQFKNPSYVLKLDRIIINNFFFSELII
jgi:hypothetical protein